VSFGAHLSPIRCKFSAEREGNEPDLQYVGYQIFDWPADVDSMNKADPKERVQFYHYKFKKSEPERRQLFSKFNYSDGVICPEPLASSLFGLAIISG